MKNLRYLRKECGLTQNQLCEILNIAQSTLWGYETGKHEPDLAILKKIANYFNVSIDYLIGEVEDRLPGLVKQNETAIPRIPPEEQRLLFLFRSMTHAQQIRFIAYGEGITGAESPQING